MQKNQDTILQIVERIRETAKLNSNMNMERNTEKFNCQECGDTGFIITRNLKSQDTMRECKCRVLKRNEDQWKKSGIKLECIQEYSYQSFTPHSDVSKHMKIKSIEYANNFFDIEKMRSNSLVFMGQVGSGKTHLTIAIAAKLMKEGVDVAYFQYREATMDIKQNIMDTDTYKAKMDFYKGIRLLLLDDLFKKTKGDMQITKADINIIYDIINHRYVNHLPTIITTELLPEELLNVDEATGSRIIEMAQDYMIVITDKHCNYRLKKFI